MLNNYILQNIFIDSDPPQNPQSLYDYQNRLKYAKQTIDEFSKVNLYVG